MIEICVLAFDLKSASDFLMKMESAGYCPDSTILDKVMDLYTLQKSQRGPTKAKSKGGAGAQGVPAGEVVASPLAGSGTPASGNPFEMMFGPKGSGEELEMRAKLSSAAPAFVPTFGEQPIPASAPEPASSPRSEPQDPPKTDDI